MTEQLTRQLTSQLTNEKVEEVEKVEKVERIVYNVDVFLKYREYNKVPHPNFEKYYIENNNSYKFKRHDSLDRPDIKTKLNFILSRKNLSSEDDTVYKLIMKTLNKVNNNILDPTKPELFNSTIQTLTDIKYTKVEHFKKLADLMVEKSLNEPTFCSVYAALCTALSCYYIDVNDNKKVYFRHILLNLCQTLFETFINTSENVDSTKFVGLMKFLGELYVRGLLTLAIIRGCIDRLITKLNDSYNIANGLSEMIIVTHAHIAKENQEVINNIKTRLIDIVNDNKISLKSKFALQNALDILTV